jgi:ferredoxin-NADP reductase
MIPRPVDTELILLATGVGLGPCHSLIRHLTPTHRRMTLYWGLRLESDICLTNELDELREANPEFRYGITLSRPSAEWSGLRGRITESLPPLLTTLGDKSFYLTSNGAMIAEMKAALEEKGVMASHIYVESFFDHRHRPSSEAVNAIRGRFVATDLAPMFTTLNG